MAGRGPNAAYTRKIAHPYNLIGNVDDSMVFDRIGLQLYRGLGLMILEIQ
jgi:hypothetical protein